MIITTNEEGLSIAIEGVFSFTAVMEGLLIDTSSNKPVDEQIEKGYPQILSKGKLKHIQNNHIKGEKKGKTLFYKSFVKDLDELKEILGDVFRDNTFVSELSEKVNAAISDLDNGQIREIHMTRDYDEAVGYNPEEGNREINTVFMAFKLKKMSKEKCELSISTMYPPS